MINLYDVVTVPFGHEGLLISYGEKREKPTWTELDAKRAIDQGSRLAARL